MQIPKWKRSSEVLVEHNTSENFNVPKITFFKGAFEIPMEFLKNRENYTLIVQYKDFSNTNPNCEYASHISFFAQLPSHNGDYFKIISVFVCFLFALMVLLCFLLRWSFSKKTLIWMKKYLFPLYEESPSLQNISSFSLPHQEVNTLYTQLETSEDPYEIPRENITVREFIGKGDFGIVYRAKVYNFKGLPGYIMAAAKLQKENAPKEEQADFQAEIKILKKIGVHENIVTFLGCVTKSQPYMTVMELVENGDLKKYLLKLREIWVKNMNQRLFFPDDMEEEKEPLKINEIKPNSEYVPRFPVDIQTPPLLNMGARPKPVLDHTELEKFALQIATGMAYLEKIPITHRDLAARNILITKDNVLKITDFGMSRCGPYVNRHLKKMPLRWMAIEAIQDFKTDSRSDVWSFGVVLWEIGTLGAFPYKDTPDSLVTIALKSGMRLPRPEICTDDLYALMRECWIENPANRPTFANIVERFNSKKQHVYVDFKKINPKYVFPPTEPKWRYGECCEGKT